MDDFYDRTGSSSCWKIRDAESWDGKSLRKIMIYHNFHLLQNTKMARLRELYLRCERGKPSYEGIPLSELKRYAAQRDLTPNPPATIASMKAQLEQADDKNNSFHRFLDLPPELRESIYTQYLIPWNDADGDDNPKCQPPITYASRTVRREALPLFYECFFFLPTCKH